MIAISDSSKAVSRIGARPVPVEVLPDSRAFVSAAIDGLGSTAIIRREHDGTASVTMTVTDQDNIILIGQFGASTD
jgi:ribose 5-phosphate isomerase A